MNSGAYKRMTRRLRELNIRVPAPFSIERFCQEIAAARNRQIHLIPWDTTTAVVPCGLWISTATADYIVYEQAAARVLRDHIVLHELSHLLLGHSGAVDLQDTTRLFALLDPSMVQRVLGRTGLYAAREERDAETLASLIGEQSSGHAPPATDPSRPGAVLSRFSAALAADRTWRD